MISDMPNKTRKTCRTRKTIKDMEKLAQKHGGNIVPNQTYINNRTSLNWKCNQCGNIFRSNPLDVQRGHWCPTCSSLHITESKCRFVCESLTNSFFQKSRKILDNKFELDGFNAKLHCAFEYHSEYHYRYIPFFHRNRTLEEVQNIDRIKENLCKEKGIKLLTIPFSIAKQHDILEKHARDFFVSNNIKVKKKIDWSEFKGNVSILKRLQAIAKSKGGIFLSTSYQGSTQLHSWKCEYGHIFQSRPKDVKQGYWCRQCGIKRRAQNRFKNMDYLQTLADKNEGFILSREYKGSKVKHSWQCGQCGNIFQMMPNAVQVGRWCPPCGRKRIGIKLRRPWSRKSLAGKYN
ncbi:hypothetical protein LCGC14_1357090 [marine sediment metagenome]|uniref:Zinc-ribbon domain-containing protein n=1 Tax=marine sediment metagenome TaxID=412755 RepID=A0A0F9NBE3_9ZZZZ